MINGYKIIALCICRLHDEESATFITEMNQRVIREGYRLFVYGTCSDMIWSDSDEKGESSIFDLIHYDKIDAVVIYEEKMSDKKVINEIIAKANAHNLPVITVGKSLLGSISAGFDYKKGFEQVVRHVVEDHGITSLHYIGGMPDNFFSEDRLQVFKDVLAENGIPVEEGMLSYGYFWDGPTRAVVEELVQKGKLPKAIICANDVMAMTTCSVLRSHGYSVPEDVIVTGFDGIDDIYFSIPPITSCFCCYKDLAEKVTEILNKCFEGGTVEKEGNFVVPRLILSTSCGCNNNSPINVSEHLRHINNRFYIFREANQDLTKRSLQVHHCETPEEIAEKMKTYMILDMDCVVKKECIEEKANPDVMQSAETFGEELYLLYSTEEDFTPRSFLLHEIVPNLDKLLGQERPLIFAALHFMSVPLGYACFHFELGGFDNFDRITVVVNAFNNAVSGFRHIRYQHFLTRQLVEMYQSDTLTGLYNRNGFMREYGKLIPRLAQSGGQFSVMLVDLDGLKYINDNFGHGEGDVAIQAVALALKHVCPQGALCGRLGGDEMLSVFEGVSDEKEIRKSIDTYLEEYNNVSGKPYKVAASIGVYTAEYSEMDDFAEVFKKADQLMYIDKNNRKKRKG